MKSLYDIIGVEKISVFIVENAGSGKATELVLTVNREMRDRGMRFKLKHAGLAGTLKKCFSKFEKCSRLCHYTSL